MSSYSIFLDQYEDRRRRIGWFRLPSTDLTQRTESSPAQQAEQESLADTTITNITDTTQIDLVGWKYQDIVDDPFALTLDEFLKLSLKEAREMQKKAFDLCKRLIEESWKKGARQVVVCDRRIIYETTSNDDIPNELVEQLAKKHNKACYVFSAPDMVEDMCIWTGIDDHDSYPTICLYIGSEETSDSELVEKTSPIQTDFDTGNPYYRVFDANRFTEPLITFTALQMRQGTHLGVNYTYFQKKVKICVKDENGNIHSIVRNIRLVRDWSGSALLQASPNRIGYVGRDIQRDLGIKLELDPSKKMTRILN